MFACFFLCIKKEIEMVALKKTEFIESPSISKIMNLNRVNKTCPIDTGIG